MDTQDPIGENPYEHLYFFVHTPERTKRICSELSDIIKPGMSVLDLGCGSLGVFSIVAAKLGATRVVGVDTGNLEFARAAATDNNVNVTFIEEDMDVLNLDGEQFDVILGLINYDNPLISYRCQKQININAKRFSKSTTILLPDLSVRIIVGYGYNNENNQRNLNSVVEDMERQLSLNLNCLKNQKSFSYKKFLYSPKLNTKELGTHPTTEQITEQIITNTDYYSSSLPPYPFYFELTVTTPGILTSILWIQQAWFNKKLLREWTFESPIKNFNFYNIGDKINIITDDNAHLHIQDNT